MEKKIITPEKLVEEIENVTAEDIRRAARKYFTKENLCLTIRGPLNKEYTERIEKQVSILRAQK